MNNLKKFAVNPTGRLHLRDANESLMYARYSEEGKPDLASAIAVNLYGPGSKEHASATSAQNNRVMNRLKHKGKIDQSPEQKAQEDAEFLADITQSFENLQEGEAKTTDRGAILAVYLDIEVGFVRDQVAKHANDWANFSKPSAKN